MNAYAALHDIQMVQKGWFLQHRTKSIVWGCYVQKQYHRQGMGRAMLQSLLGALSDYKGVIVHVLNSSSEAQQFYKELGFTIRDTTEYELVQGVTFSGHMFSVLAGDLKID